VARVLLSAHRGGPEEMFLPNSVAAIRAATEIGVDLVEFDVRVTRDGGYVTSHDATVTIDGTDRPVEELTEAEVLAGARGAARLEDVLRTLKGHAVAHVDLKDSRDEVEIADVCESLVGPEGFLLTTLEDVSVFRVRRARPHLRVALSLGRDTSGLGRWRSLAVRVSEVYPARRVRHSGANMLAINYRVGRLGAVWWARRHGIPVLLWTINTPELMRKAWRSASIWAFTTDYPRQALRLREAAERPDRTLSRRRR
jgi:glycerophosphoryl diester phosphodiesterase